MFSGAVLRILHRLDTPALALLPPTLGGRYGSSYHRLFVIRTEIMKVNPIRINIRGLNSSFKSQDLATKKCVPCDSKDIRPMSTQAANELLHQLQGWSLVTEDGIMKLHRSWKAKTFMKGLDFFQIVANLAEEEGHHPDLHLVGWNNVKVDIWTHSIGGLTENDFILAAKVDRLDIDHLIRRRAVA